MLTTLDAARDMQRRHAKLLRDIDRLRSILPPDFAATAFMAPRNALPFLFMGQATKHEIRWMAETVRRTT